LHITYSDTLSLLLFCLVVVLGFHRNLVLAMAEVTETPAAAEVQETPVEAAKEETPAAEETPAVNGEAEAAPENGHENGTNGHAEEANGHSEENGKEEAAAEAEEKTPEAEAEPPVKKAKKSPKVPSNANRRSSSRLTNATTGTKLSAEISSDNLPKGACWECQHLTIQWITIQHTIVEVNLFVVFRAYADGSEDT